MYHQNSNRNSSQRGRNNYSGRPNRNGRSFGGGRHFAKKLNPNIYVNKAATQIQEETFQPINSFETFQIDEKIKRNILEHGYKAPTPIQDQVIPAIINGRDVIGIANTGTGKTASFLIPLINKTYLNRYERVLIMAPTRELAMQIKDEFKFFAKGTDLEALICIGGANLHRQESNLRQNPHFVIGTPGRLKDLVQRRKLNLMMFQNIVLDETDRMVDIGFINDIKYLISQLPQKRQSLFFSATVDGKTREILQNFVTDPVTVSVKTQETAGTIEQDIIRVSDKNQKLDKLHDLLAQEEFSKVLIFGRTKWGIEKLSKTLIMRGFRAASIHGNKSQGQRQRALDGFKNGDIQILLATDVASRGLDIEDVSHVINYDEPASYEDYVHRIGRTGRAGKRGIALTFVE
ncbi:MAG: DEAD/DEAH box helicase [Candidatus Levybacteria bacterium]|nr:DEAD/DEAH box helicase [Candidatus Levybacteria bacterium]